MKFNLTSSLLVLLVLMYSCSGNSSKKAEPELSVPLVSGIDLSNLDTTADACGDFWQYACGGWIANNPIPKTEGRWGNFSQLAEANNLRVKNIMEELAKKDSFDSHEQELVAKFYRAAMDTGTINEQGLSEISDLFEGVSRIKSTKNLVQYWASLEKMGIKTPFATRVSADDKNSSAYILNMYQSGLGLPDREYYLSEGEKMNDIRNSYQNYIAQLMVSLGKTENEAKEMSTAIIELETKLARASMDRVVSREPDSLYNKMTTNELFEKYPNLSLDLYMNSMGISTEDLLVGQLFFMNQLNRLVDEMPLTSWKIYTNFHIINSLAPYLSDDLQQMFFDFYSKKLNGIEERKPRWKIVVDMGNRKLGDPIGREYVAQYFSQEAKDKVGQMVENLRAAFKDRIEGLDWMGEETKKEALKKLAAFKYKIGFPEEWKDFSEVALNNSSYVQHILELNEHSTLMNLSKLGKPVDKKEWFMPVQIVNAYYSPEFNEIVFPAGILQAPFYNVEADDAVNYGGIGAVIGHEFSHGFDDKGSKYDAEGNLKVWWTEDDRKRFDAKTTQLAEQYNTYEALPGEFVNGKLTLGENIADLGGLTLGYYAYQKSLNGKEAPVIDGFTGAQRFFLGWGQVWASNYTEAALSQQIKVDPHAPAIYRVKGPLVNMVEFEEAFSCQAHDNKALIW